MLDDFKDVQPIAYSLLYNAIKNNELSHAYLFDTNNYRESFEFILAFVKGIICGKFNNDEMSDIDYNLCKRIDNNNYTELKIIVSIGSVIKKEQLLELQSDFSLSSIEGNYRIYIIKDCDKMNKYASNCLLKFLEEPSEGVIAILLTNNFNRLLSTVISRCQVIRLNNMQLFQCGSTIENLALLRTDTNELYNEFVNDSKNLEIISAVLSFLNYFEDNGLDTLLYMRDLWYSKVSTRDDTYLAFILIVYFYYDVLKDKIGNKVSFFCDKFDIIRSISSHNSIDSILKKIDIAVYAAEMVGYNLNINLLLDDIVIRLGDVCEYS